MKFFTALLALTTLLFPAVASPVAQRADGTDGSLNDNYYGTYGHDHQRREVSDDITEPLSVFYFRKYHGKNNLGEHSKAPNDDLNTYHGGPNSDQEKRAEDLGDLLGHYFTAYRSDDGKRSDDAVKPLPNNHGKNGE